MKIKVFNRKHNKKWLFFASLNYLLYFCRKICIMYNIIIPVIYRDYSFLRTTLRYLNKYLTPKTIYLITDIRFRRFLPKEVLKDSKCIVIDENGLIDGMTQDALKELFSKLGRNKMEIGWYFQQFLKMAFALSAYCDEEYYLSWDSDTIPLRQIDFFDEKGNPYFTMKSEHHVPYFIAIERLLGITKTNGSSYIAENMMFKKSIMKEMIIRIQSNSLLAGNVWYEKIIYALEPESISPMGFSEFETYGNYCLNYHPDFYKERTLPSFRKGGLIQGRFVSDKILAELSFDQATASFEIYDRPPFPWYKLSHWYARWQRRKELFIRRWLL